MDTRPRVLGDRYELLSPLARGGMGQVWRARDRLLNRQVAVKILRSEFTDDAAFRARFRAEAQHSAMLMHPHIAQVFDYGEVSAEHGDEHLAYLVMELVDGESLAALLQRERRLDTRRAVSILRQTAAALAVAHAAGVVHRDVKPGNVLIAPDGTAKITDFGIAWSASSVPLTQTGQVIGTAHYLSPEQAEGGKATPASDVYALGAVAYECLAGRRVFDGESSVQIIVRHIRDQPDPLPADVPADVQQVVMRALAKDPAVRYADGAALRDAVDALGTGRPVSPTGTAVMALPFVGGAGPATAVLAGAAGAGPGAALPPSRAAAPRGSGARRGLVLAALGVLAVLALVTGIALAGDGSPGRTATTTAPATTSATPTSPTGVRVDAADHVGRPVDEVRADLVGLGLQVELTPVTTGEVPEGQVTGLDPTGTLEPGARVGVSYAVAPVPQPEPPAGDGEGDGDGDKGKGEGKGKGNDKDEDEDDD